MATRTIAAPRRCCGENSPIPSILTENTAPAGASLMLAAPMASSYRKRGPTSTWPAIAEEAATFCRKQSLRVLTGMADEYNLAQLGMMDVITLLDVLEHLPSPHETLALCTRYLSPGGVILITTGDFASHSARVAGARWRLMTPPQHLWYFTLESVERMSHALGLRVEWYDHPWKIVPISLVAFQIRRMLGMRTAGTSTTSGVGLPVNLFDAMRIVLRKSA